VLAKDINDRLTYCFGNEIEYFQELGSILNNKNLVVMLGVGPAIMALALLEGATEEFEFWGVDKYNITGKDHLEASGFADRMQILEELTWDAAEHFEDNSIDILIVDASHDKDSVDKDIKAWYSKVKQNGIMFFHDFEKLEEVNGVAEAIEENKTLFWQEVSRPGISIVYRKLA